MIRAWLKGFRSVGCRGGLADMSENLCIARLSAYTRPWLCGG